MSALTVLHTNDLHSHLAERTDGEEPVGGLPRMAGLVRHIRATEPYVLLLDAGDFLSGTPFYTYYGGRAEIDCMNEMCYDAVAVGNHELDKGPDALLELAEDADFALLSANLTWRRDGQLLVQPYLFFETDELTIAVLGLTTAGIHARVRPSAVAPLAAKSPIETAREIVPVLRDQAQAVIVLSHLGVEEDKTLAYEVPGIDLIVGGDSHVLLEEPIKIQNPASDGPTYVVQAGCHCRYLGRVDMLFVDGTLIDVDSRVMPVRSVIPEDPRLAKIVNKYWNSMEKMVTRVVAHASAEFTRDHDLRNGESALGNLIADITRAATGADFAVQNAGGIRAGMGPGPITVWDVYQTLPFDNRLLTLEMSGMDVETLVSDVARRLGRNSFCQVSGISFAIAGGKAHDIKIGGEPIDSTKKYTVGAIDYLVEGGDHYGILTKVKVISSTSLYQRDIAVEYLKEARTLSPRIEGRIQIIEPEG